jgi:HEAT repeat protein
MEVERAPELITSSNPTPVADPVPVSEPVAVNDVPEADPFLPVEAPTAEPEVVASAEPKVTVTTEPAWDDNLWVGNSNPAEPRQVEPSEGPIEFVQPVVQQPKTVQDAELAMFFGPFEIQMVQTLKNERDRYQTKLAKVACDQEMAVEVRSRAIFLLGAVGPQANEAVPVLRRLMHEDQDQFLKVDICEAILKIQAEDEDAIRSLVSCLKDPDPQLRWIAVFALRSAVSPKTTYIIEELREVLNTDDAKLRRMVFLTLAEFGPAASAALPEIQLALDSSDNATKQVAKAAMESIAPLQGPTSR